MTQGGFLAPTSKALGNLMQSWLAEHPSAESIVVYTLDGMRTDVPDSKMKAVWIVDGGENLNLHLVRMGAVPAGTMVLNRGDKTSLAENQYADFAKRVWAAEGMARKEKIGIWGEKT